MVKILLLADTHLGFDLPVRPRVERRRRGPDFFANTRLALEPARRGEVDVVVHGGDLLYRSKVSAGLVAAALEPLLEVAARVFYPGSVERTSLAERHEAKGFLTLEVAADGGRGGTVVDHVFHELPTRPMCAIVVDPAGLDAAALSRCLSAELSALDPDAVVQLRIDGDLAPGAEAALRAENVRSLHPPTMTVDLRLKRPRR